MAASFVVWFRLHIICVKRHIFDLRLSRKLEHQEQISEVHHTASICHPTAFNSKNTHFDLPVTLAGHPKTEFSERLAH